jgi:hypothetical protein
LDMNLRLGDSFPRSALLLLPKSMVDFTLHNELYRHMAHKRGCELPPSLFKEVFVYPTLDADKGTSFKNQSNVFL